MPGMHLCATPAATSCAVTDGSNTMAQFLAALLQSGSPSLSPRMTAPYHTLAPLPSFTSPMTEALGATNTSLPSTGRLPANACTHCALFTAECGKGPGGGARGVHRRWRRRRRPLLVGGRGYKRGIGVPGACNWHSRVSR